MRRVLKVRGASRGSDTQRCCVVVRWGRHLIAAYVGGLVIGAPIGLVLYWMTRVGYLLTGAVLVAMISVLIWRLRTQ